MKASPPERLLLKTAPARAAALLAGSALLTMSPTLPAQRADKPNFILIICDDLNDAIAGLGRIPSAATPNLDRLRARGVTFTNAAVNCPICLPSRSSLLTGLHSRTLDHYRLNDAIHENPLITDSVMLPGFLRTQGYATFGAGKIFHNGATAFRGDDPARHWDRFEGGPNYGPFPFNESAEHPLRKLLIHPRQAHLVAGESIIELGKKFNDPFWMFDNHEMKFNFEHGFAPLEDVPPGGWRWPDGTPFRFTSDADRDLLEDEKIAAFAAEILARPAERPFFFAGGFIRPHTPLYVPKTYFDLFPPESIPLPPVLEDELAGVAPAHRDHRPYGQLRWEVIKAGGEQTWREWLQAYLASIAFMDAQLGVILDALEKSPHAGNTYVIFTSDNGYHMGDKDSLFKDTLWESSARVPLIIAGPGVAAGKECAQPVSLLDLYPTLLDLAGLPDTPHAQSHGCLLDGHSLAPLLRDPTATGWTGPTINVTGVRGLTGTHFSARSATHRYILCQNGEEELYDHTKDPFEHRNLAHDPACASLKADLRRQLEAELARFDANQSRHNSASQENLPPNHPSKIP